MKIKPTEKINLKNFDYDTCLFIINGSKGIQYYDARFHTKGTASYDYRMGNNIITSFRVVYGMSQELNVDYL